MFQKTFRDIAELSQTSGLSISTIRRLVRDHRIPFLQPSGKGGKLLFPVDALGERQRLPRSGRLQPVDSPGDSRCGWKIRLEKGGPMPENIQNQQFNASISDGAFFSATASTMPTGEEGATLWENTRWERANLRTDALKNLGRSTRRKAADYNLIPKDSSAPAEDISIAQGWSLFMEDRGQPNLLGGVGTNSLKRYKAIRDKHLTYCQERQLNTWRQVDRAAVLQYGSWLHKRRLCPANA